MEQMNKIETILKSDFILSFGTYFEDNQELKSSILNNKSKFVYMFPIDNSNLKSTYSQFIKYEVGSEEGICALLLATFAKNCDEATKEFIENLDLGYISAESSAGEEEFEEAKEASLASQSKVLIVGNDIKNHERVENITKILALIKKYTDFNLVVLDEDLEQKINSHKDLELDEIEDLKSFNGTLVYKLVGKKCEELIASKTFANIAKVSNNDEIYINSKDEKIKRVLKVDESLTGTIAILEVLNEDDIFSGYKYKQVKIEKVEA